MLIAAGLFVNSLLTAGPIWDEPDEFSKLTEQLAFARDVLLGSGDRTFRSIPGDRAFYGIGTVLPAYALSYLIDIVWLKGIAHTFERSCSLLLHLITFLCAIAGVHYTRCLVGLATRERETPFLAGTALLVTPFWIGYGFFDYKDIPVATGVVAATCYAAAYMQDRRDRPACAIAVRNSTLYDGIRHTLFLVPLTVAMVFVTLPETFWVQRRAWLAGYLLFLLVDMITLQPYQYVWFNEVARFFANEKNYETDFWGYSMREAAAHARGLQGPTDWVISPNYPSNPRHLAEIFLTERFSTDTAPVAPGATYLLVSSTRANTQPPKECDGVDYVTRRQLLAPGPLHLAFVARCRN